MKIIAKTDGGYMLEATKNEVKEIIRSVTGSVPSDINIGMKIPAIDYASTILKLKTLSESSPYTTLLTYTSRFNSAVDGLIKAVESCNDIDI